MKTIRLLTLLLLFIGTAGLLRAETVLTIDKVVDRALDHNRQLLSAREGLSSSEGEIISARAGALPQLSLDGRYTRNLTRQEIFLGSEKIPISRNNDFDLTLSLTQPLYIGGKVRSALAIAKIYKDYSVAKVEEVRRNIVYQAEAVFYNAVLAKSNLDVIKKAYEQKSYSLEIAEKNYDQGMISEYELLRARVEKLNVEPQMVAAESNLNVSRKQLKSFIGLPLQEDIKLVAPLDDTSATELPTLDSLLDQAIAKRPELREAILEKQGRKKAIQIAKSDWLYPSLSLNGTYQWSASTDNFSIRSQEQFDNWRVSLLLNIPLFDGGKAIGEVRKAKATYYQAELAEKQLYDDIKLEVEAAYDKMVQARKALTSQNETIVQAEEAMRIADLSYESGMATQLEVLAAQTALTQARTQLAETIFNLRLARAQLKKATGYDIK